MKSKSKKKYNIVYITTNLITKKQYVGSHSTDNIEDKYVGSGKYLLSSIKKYGIDNFSKKILNECSTAIKARNLESFYIKKFDTMYPNGYNLSPKGGIGFNGACLGETTKQKISKANKGKKRTDKTKNLLRGIMMGRPSPMKGKQHSTESKEKMSKSRTGLRCGEKHHYFNKHRDEDTRKKISNSLTGISLDEERKIKLRNASLNIKKIKCNHCEKYFTPWGLKNHENAIMRNKNK